MYLTLSILECKGTRSIYVCDVGLKKRCIYSVMKGNCVAARLQISLTNRVLIPESPSKEW